MEQHSEIQIVKKFIDWRYASDLFVKLSETIDWKQVVTRIDTGQEVKLNRKMAYLSDTPTMYKYANFQFQGDAWGNRLQLLKTLVKVESKADYNSCLLNYYRNGKDEIRWHSDNEPTLGTNPVIACVNLGATRKFWFRSKEAGSEPFYYTVESGDLLVMGPHCQSLYLHAILKEKEVTEPRISLTFRYNYD